jgi:hypothetical protein
MYLYKGGRTDWRCAWSFLLFSLLAPLMPGLHALLLYLVPLPGGWSPNWSQWLGSLVLGELDDLIGSGCDGEITMGVVVCYVEVEK